jgi:protein Tex
VTTAIIPNPKHIQLIAAELSVDLKQVAATLALLDDDATVPFVARYRKEVTGSLDEVAVADIRDRIAQLRELDKRRDAILKSIDEQGKMTDELKASILASESLTKLEDIYLPYRPKRRTRATIAREKGLEPLAEVLFAQESIDLAKEAEAFIDAEKGVESTDDALAGARDIIAEWVNEDADARAKMRDFFAKHAAFHSVVLKGKENEGAKFRDYFEWDEPIARAPSHRILAMRRGEKEGFLSLRVMPVEEEAVTLLTERFVKSEGVVSEQVHEAVEDSYKRLLSPSMETEMRLATKERADGEAIRVFSENLRELLLASPLGQKNVLAIDPGQRTGCKVVCLDRQGKLLFNTAIYPHPPQRQVAQSATVIKELCKRFKIEAIAIGNGTAGRESETFCRGLGLKDVMIVMVNESGASIYSASKVARDEFPDEDLTVRGSVSIGRRLMDPLAELVKIDAKSIGVGQYQHDVDPTALKNGLDDVVVSCVNRVGVEVNTASKELLTYVSGLGPSLAKSVVDYRNEHGAFNSRKEILKVPRLGPKAFEQAAGFLRIRDGKNPLDASAVHPESYSVVDAIAKDLGRPVAEIIGDAKLAEEIDLEKYVSDTVGLPTLQDIVSELGKPGRDPREKFEAFSFADGVEKIGDLEVGMKLPGLVTNVTAFGAFVDIGVHQDGLVHISQLADRFVSDPSEVVKVQQQVEVTVLEVDLDRKRISLSMRNEPAEARSEKKDERRTGPAKRPQKRDARKPRQKKPERQAPQKPESKPFNNPFGDFFKTWKGGDSGKK